MENQIGIASSLIAEPKKDFMSLARAQLGFMNLFAIPLFQGVADVLPRMRYTVDELEGNRALFEKAIEEFPEMGEEKRKLLQSGTVSQRTMEMAIIPESSRDSSSGSTLDAPYQSLPEDYAKAKQASSSPPGQPQQIPNIPGEYKEVNGFSEDFDHVGGFAASDPFSTVDGAESFSGHNGKQRCSETTEGSNSAPYSGDWASQATSATTGKMPISPSTQGTSIISQESVERTLDVPVTTVTGPEPNNLGIPLPPMEPMSSMEEHSNGSTLKLDGTPGMDRSPSSNKSLKKKPSRFRMNALKLFRRDKSNSSPSSGENGG